MRLGKGAFVDSQAGDNSGRRYARWHYFKAILRNQPKVLQGLGEQVFPVYTELFLANFPSSYAGLRDRRFELFPPVGPIDAYKAGRSDLSHEWRPDHLEKLSRLEETLTAWANNYGLLEIGEWILDAALSVLKSWTVNWNTKSASFDGPPSGWRLYGRYYTGGAQATFGPGLKGSLFFVAIPREFCLNALYDHVKGADYVDLLGSQPGGRLTLEALQNEPFLDALYNSIKGLDVETLSNEVQKMSQETSHIIAFDYEPEIEARAVARKRILNQFTAALEKHLDAREKDALKQGLKPTVHKRPHGNPASHFDWLYRRHIEGWEYKQIADYYAEEGEPVTESNIYQRVKELAELVGVNLT